MIQINDNFSFDHGDHCWQLHEKRQGVNPKTKAPTVTTATTFHGSILQVCKAVIDRSVGEAASVQGIIEELLRVEAELLKAINSMEKQ